MTEHGVPGSVPCAEQLTAQPRSTSMARQLVASAILSSCQRHNQQSEPSRVSAIVQASVRSSLDRGAWEGADAGYPIKSTGLKYAFAQIRCSVRLRTQLARALKRALGRALVIVVIGTWAGAGAPGNHIGSFTPLRSVRIRATWLGCSNLFVVRLAQTLKYTYCK